MHKAILWHVPTSSLLCSLFLVRYSFSSVLPDMPANGYIENFDITCIRPFSGMSLLLPYYVPCSLFDILSSVLPDMPANGYIENFDMTCKRPFYGMSLLLPYYVPCSPRPCSRSIHHHVYNRPGRQ